ncbi:hypothetical protein HAX54_006359, partial [Datura stramonium]|nr:hypothetical protein [Datura stramonium]
RVSFPHRRRPKIVFGERERVAAAQPRSSSRRYFQLRTSANRSQIDQRENLVLKINSRAVNRRRESAAATVADCEQQCSPDRSAVAASSQRRKKKKKGQPTTGEEPDLTKQSRAVAQCRRPEKNQFFLRSSSSAVDRARKKKLLPVATPEKNQAVIAARSVQIAELLPPSSSPVQSCHRRHEQQI